MPQTEQPEFTDFHTHAGGCALYQGHNDTFVVQSVQWEREAAHPRANALTVGIHPMQPNALLLLERYGNSPQEWTSAICRFAATHKRPLLAIGECGWDNRSPLTAQQQEALMQLHLYAAQQLSVPLVLHNVGNLHKVLALQSQKGGSVRLWLHGFRGKPATFQQLLRAGLGLSLHPRYPATLPLTAEHFSSGQVRLETDDTHQLVRECYNRVAQQHNLPLQTLTNLSPGYSY